MKKLFIILISIFLCINVFAQEGFQAQASALFNEGEFEQAVEVLTQAIEYREKPEWRTYFLRSIVYANTEKLNSALNDTEIALQKINLEKNYKKENIHRIYSVRAEIFKLAGDFGKAIKEISTAIKFAPNDEIEENLLKIRADYHFYNENFAASIKDYEQVLIINPKNLTMKMAIVRSIMYEQEEKNAKTGKVNLPKLKKALSLANEVIAIDPEYDAAYKFRVRAHILLGNTEAALRDSYLFRNRYSTIVTSMNYDEAAEYAENRFFFYANIDSVLAEKILLEEIAKKTNNPLPYYLSAMLYSKSENYKKGIEMLTEAINKTDRELNELLIQRARFYAADENYDSALTDLHIAKQQNDSNAYIFYLEGIFYNKIENWEEAAKSFGEVIRIKPDISEGYLMRANAYQKMKNFDFAQTDFESALELDSTDVEVLVPYAYFYTEKGDRKTSNEVYQKVLDILDSIAQEVELNEEYLAMIYNNMAYNCVKLGEYEQAEKYVKKALELNDESGYIWDTRGELYFWQKKYEKCIADMNKAIELAEQDENDREPANSYFYRGRAKLALGQTEEGNADIQKAVELKHEEAIEFVETKS